MARPPSNLYRFQKLVRRNKLAFIAAAAISTVLLLGVMVSTSEAIRARQAEREQIQLRQQAEADETKARTEAAKATAISDFLQQSLQSANPDEMKGSEYTVRQLLDDYSVGLENQFKDQPEVEASVRATLGQTYYRLGLADKSQAQLERALMLRRHIFGSNELVAATLVDYAWTSFDQQQFAKGESQAREALDIYRKRGTAGRPVIAALWVLQETLNAQGRYTEVESVSEEALDLANKTPAVEYPETASVIHGLAQAELSLSKYPEAEALSRKAVEMHRRLHGAQHPETGWALLALGRALLDEKKLDEAEAASREALSIFSKQYTFGHKSVDNAMSELKDVLVAKGDLPGLVTFYQVTLAGQRAALGNDSPAVAETLMNLSDALKAQGKQAEADKADQEALEINLRGNAPMTASLPALLRQESQTLNALGKVPEAEKLYEGAINVGRLKLGETNLVVGELLHDYAGQLESEGKWAAAAEYFLKSLPSRRTRQDDNLAWTLRNLGGDLNQIGRYQEAEEYARESLALYHKLHQADDINGTAWVEGVLGYALWQQHKLPEAEQAYRGSLSAYKNSGAGGSGDFAAQVQSLLDVLKAENKLAEGEALCRELLAQQRAGLTNDNPAVAQTMSSLADNLAAQGKRAEAEKALREALRMFQQSTRTNSASSDDLTKLGHLQWQLGQMLTDSQQSGEAEQLFENALQVFKKASQDFPREPYLRQEQAFSHRLLGHLMESPGRWDESASNYRAAIGLYAALVADDPKSSFYLSEQSYTVWMLALALDQAGQTNQAAEEFQRAVTLHQKGMTNFPDEDVFKSRGITVRVSQADFLLRLKRYGEAEQAYRDALQICANSKAEGGEECLHTARALAELLRLENKPAEAESLMNQAIAQQQQSSGQPNAAMVAALINLADFLKSENKLEETAGRLREATDILLNLPGEELAKLPDQTVSWMIHEGPQPQARNICDKVLTGASTNAGWLNGISWYLFQTEPLTAWDATLAVELANKAVLTTKRKDAGFLDTLAAANAAAGRFTNAVAVEQEAIAVTQSEDDKKYYAAMVKLYQSNTPYRDHGLLAEHTLALLEQGKFAAAEPLARECLALREIMIPDDWRTFNARSMLGGSLLGQKKYAEAEPLLLSGYEGLKQREDKIPAAGNMRPREALQRLVQLYEETGRPELAAQWKKLLAPSDPNKK